MYDSVDVARAAVKLSVTPTRSEEEKYIAELKQNGINGVAVDIGGDIINSTHIIIERAIIASRKAGINFILVRRTG